MNRNKGKRALVIDDQRDSLLILRHFLEEMKYEHIEMELSAEKGLELIEACIEKPFDLILSDYNMGESMNGQQLLEELTRRGLIGYKTLFIMASGETSKEMVLSALECRPDAYIAKPFNFKTISSKINQLLDERHILQPVFEAQKKGDVAEAIRACRSIVNSSPSPSLKLLRFFGDVLLDYKEYQEAHDQFQNCTPKNPPDWAIMGKARALVGLGQEIQAMQVLERLVSTVTSELKVYDMLAELKLRNNRPLVAQEVLGKAIALSPNTFTRQRNYAQLCLDNGDTDTAIRSSKHALKLARFTSNKSPENYVTLAQAQMAHAEQLEPLDARKMTDEALRNLAVAADDKRATDWIGISVILGEASQKKLDSQTDEAHDLLDQAIRRATDTLRYMKEELPSIIGCAKQFYKLGSPSTANHILKRLSEIFSEDADILNRLDRVSTEPITPEGKRKATETNAEGGRCYKSGDYDGAIDKFEEGISMFPRSIEFQLNYILASISKMENQGANKYQKDECNKHIELVKKLGATGQHEERLSKMSRRLRSI